MGGRQQAVECGLEFGARTLFKAVDGEEVLGKSCSIMNVLRASCGAGELKKL